MLKPTGMTVSASNRSGKGSLRRSTWRVTLATSRAVPAKVKTPRLPHAPR